MKHPIDNCDEVAGAEAMAKTRPNERIKHAYLDYVRHTLGRSEASLNDIAAALHRFEKANGYRDFRKFHIEQAKAFKARLADARSVRSGEQLSAATVTSTLTVLRTFFRWLATQPGYRSRISSSDADYFTPSARDARVASARRQHSVPTLEQIHAVLASMPSTTDIQKRDRALVAFTILTGARDGALVTFQLKHLDIAARRIDQDAREVATKRAKTFSTFFFPVGGEVERIVCDWASFLRTERLWGDGDPLFPATETGVDANGHFAPVGLARSHWASAGPVRSVFKEAFAAIGLPYANPHSFRNTLVQLAYRLKLPPEQFKAWSQNLGHDNVMTTLTSYGALPQYRQGQVMQNIANARANSADELASEIVALLVERNGTLDQGPL